MLVGPLGKNNKILGYFYNFLIEKKIKKNFGVGHGPPQPFKASATS